VCGEYTHVQTCVYVLCVYVHTHTVCTHCVHTIHTHNEHLPMCVYTRAHTCTHIHTHCVCMYTHIVCIAHTIHTIHTHCVYRIHAFCTLIYRRIGLVFLRRKTTSRLKSCCRKHDPPYRTPFRDPPPVPPPPALPERLFSCLCCVVHNTQHVVHVV